VAAPLTQDEKLACLAARIYLNFHPTNLVDPSNLESILVEKHMRICIAVVNQRTSLITVAPSEPLLAEAASSLMGRRDFNAPTSLLYGLQCSGIDKGDQGELVGMLLLLLAHN
jgi:hypothetical protein